MKLKNKCKGSGERKKKKVNLQIPHTTDTIIRFLELSQLSLTLNSIDEAYK